MSSVHCYRSEHAAPADAAPLLTGTVGPGSQSTATPLLCKSAVSASQQHVRRLLHPHRSCTTICRPHKQHSVNVQIGAVGMIHTNISNIVGIVKWFEFLNVVQAV